MLKAVLTERTLKRKVRDEAKDGSEGVNLSR
jgi:hypothetical protein